MRIVGSIQGRPSVSNTSFSVRGYMSLESRRRVLSVLVSTTTGIDPCPLTPQSYRTSGLSRTASSNTTRERRNVLAHPPSLRPIPQIALEHRRARPARSTRPSRITSKAHRQLPKHSRHTSSRSVSQKSRETHTSRRSPSSTSPAARR